MRGAMAIPPGTARWALVLAALCTACQEDGGRATPAGKSRATASSSDQTFDEAMRIVCDAPDKAELPAGSAFDSNRIMLMAVWIDQRVHNREVRELMGGVSSKKGAQGKINALESGARRAGIARCSLAELWRSGAAARAEASSRGGAANSPGGASEPDAPPLPSEPQTYDEAIAILCDAATRANLPDRPADPGADDAAIAHQLSTEISNPDVVQLFASLRAAPLPRRVKLLREAAKKSGVASCALADRWTERAK